MDPRPSASSSLIHHRGDGHSGLLALSSAVHQKRHPADAARHRRNVKGTYEIEPNPGTSNRGTPAHRADLRGGDHAAGREPPRPYRHVANIYPPIVLGVLHLH